MAEFERVLAVLLHDLRSPLSVASGYVRLLRLERLETLDARDKAWRQTAAALTRMARLCDDAAGFLPAAASESRPIAVATLVMRVRQHCRRLGIDLDDGLADVAGEPMLQVPADADQLAGAIATLAQLHQARDGAVRLDVSLDDRRRLRCVVRPVDAGPSRRDAAPFDPWTGPGLTAALASHVVVQAAGDIRSAREFTMTFPLQGSPS